MQVAQPMALSPPLNLSLNGQERLPSLQSGFRLVCGLRRQPFGSNSLIHRRENERNDVCPYYCPLLVTCHTERLKAVLLKDCVKSFLGIVDYDSAAHTVVRTTTQLRTTNLHIRGSIDFRYASLVQLSQYPG